MPYQWRGHHPIPERRHKHTGEGCAARQGNSQEARGSSPNVVRLRALIIYSALFVYEYHTLCMWFKKALAIIKKPPCDKIEQVSLTAQ